MKKNCLRYKLYTNCDGWRRMNNIFKGTLKYSRRLYSWAYIQLWRLRDFNILNFYLELYERDYIQ